MPNEEFSDRDALLFEEDFTFALNLMLGKSPEQAERDARQWMRDARGDDSEEPPKSQVRRVRRITPLPNQG